MAHFTLLVSRSYAVFSSEELHRTLIQRLANLRSVKFRFQYSCIEIQFDLEKHRDISPLFKNIVSDIHKHPSIYLFTASANYKDSVECSYGFAMDDPFHPGSEVFDN